MSNYNHLKSQYAEIVLKLSAHKQTGVALKAEYERIKAALGAAKAAEARERREERDIRQIERDTAQLHAAWRRQQADQAYRAAHPAQAGVDSRPQSDRDSDDLE